MIEKYHNDMHTTVPGSGDRKTEKLADPSTMTVLFAIPTKLKGHVSPVQVAHTCNPSYLGG
jgi:hypothetical protein